MKKYWLLKSEPGSYSIDDLKKDQRTIWSGVRNYQARNYMRDGMGVGDLCLIYHSNSAETGVAGVAKVVKTGIVDQAQFDKDSEYFDASSSTDSPRWICVEVEFVKKFKRIVTLKELKDIAAQGEYLQDLLVIKKGQRLSVLPVSKYDFEYILTCVQK
jgi:predicted RNA-binding protein with PUA-like domain